MKPLRHHTPTALFQLASAWHALGTCAKEVGETVAKPNGPITLLTSLLFLAGSISPGAAFMSARRASATPIVYPVTEPPRPTEDQSIAQVATPTPCTATAPYARETEMRIDWLSITDGGMTVYNTECKRMALVQGRGRNGEVALFDDNGGIGAIYNPNTQTIRDAGQGLLGFYDAFVSNVGGGDSLQPTDPRYGQVQQVMYAVATARGDFGYAAAAPTERVMR